MTRKLFAPLLALLLAVLACNLPSGTPTVVPVVVTDTPEPPVITDTPAPTETQTVTPAAAGELSLDMLRNATYYTPFYGRTVTLVNGSYSDGSGAGGFSVRMLDQYAFGDLNGDGKFDAAVLLVESNGGSGSFVSLVAVTNMGGAPHQDSELPLGDRVQVNSADISQGVIHLNMLVHGPSDPLCCPSQAETHSYWLMGKLWLMRVVSPTASGERAINITSPANWGSVTNPFTVSGNVTISPFENTLKYTLYLLDGTKVNEGSLIVTSAGAGTPGTFSKEFNLSAAGISGLVIVQFDELSPADGSLLTRGSVVVNLP